MAFVGRNEKNGAGIQESYVAMETTAKGELETHRHRYALFAEMDKYFCRATYSTSRFLSVMSVVVLAEQEGLMDSVNSLATLYNTYIF